MRILVTGGSGAVGRQVLTQLVADGSHDITAFDIKTRQTQNLYRPYRDKLKAYYGDISNKDEVAAVCQGVDVAIHLAAIIPPLADEQPALAMQVNATGTHHLIEGLEEHSPEAFFIYASSVSVYGDRLTNPMIRVGDPLLPSEGDEYAKTKIAAEKIVMGSTLDWTIFRLSAIMGTQNHKVSGLMFHMPLATPMEITTPADTARAFVNAIGKTGALSKNIFNLGGGPRCRIAYEAFLSRSFRIFGLGKLDFPNQAFAERNFHCGYYADGDDLEEILQFRKDTIESYFDQVKRAVPAYRKYAAYPLRAVVKKYLLKQSDPYRAIRNNDPEAIRRYFGD